MGPYSECRPSGLYEVMLSRVCPYSLRGFLYYQGEEDDHKPEVYYELLSALIKQWRMDWKEDSLPFLLVQLPVFQNEGEVDYKNWPLIREAQMRAYQTIKNYRDSRYLGAGRVWEYPSNEKRYCREKAGVTGVFPCILPLWGKGGFWTGIP